MVEVELDGRRCLIENFIDITDRKEWEEKIRESEQKFRAIFDNATDGILLADIVNKKIFTGNKTICRMIGYTLEEIKNQAEQAAREGITQLILTDKNISLEKLPMPMLLCIGAVNTHLIKLGLRGYVSINVQTGDALDTHSFATLIGVGATTVNPYLAFDSLYERYTKKL